MKPWGWFWIGVALLWFGAFIADPRLSPPAFFAGGYLIGMTHRDRNPDRPPSKGGKP